jgi:hypothetical protein
MTIELQCIAVDAIDPLVRGRCVLRPDEKG